MKKIFTLLAATTLFAGAAFAQVETDPFPTQVTFSSPNGTVQTDPETGDLYLPLSQMNTTVTLTLDKAEEIVGVTPFLAIYSGTFGFSEAVYAEPIIPADTNPIVVTLDASKWGNPYMGNFYTTIMLTYLDAEGDYVLRDDEPIFFQMPCITPNELPAEFLYAYPSGEWETGDSFSKAYKPKGDGCRFNFNNVVDFTANAPMGEIVYFLKDGSEEYADITLLEDSDIQEDGVIPTGKATVGYNPLDGNYVISVQFYNPVIAETDIESIEVSLFGMSSKGVEIPDETATITNNAVEPTVQKIKKSRLAEGLADFNTSVDVYNLQGMLVKANVDKSNLKDLPAGLYIVDGKKVFIR